MPVNGTSIEPRATMIKWEKPEDRVVRDFVYAEAKRQRRSVQSQLTHWLNQIMIKHEQPNEITTVEQ